MLSLEINQLPHEYLTEVLDFIRFLKQKRRTEKFNITIASESFLKNDWLLPEEDEAWRDL